MFINVSNLKKSYLSGSGKSTLINIIGGIDRGDIGSVSVDGVEINNLNDCWNF